MMASYMYSDDFAPIEVCGPFELCAAWPDISLKSKRLKLPGRQIHNPSTCFQPFVSKTHIDHLKRKLAIESAS